jgi:hypothetical protein
MPSLLSFSSARWAGALFVLCACTIHAQSPVDELHGLARLRSYTPARISSADTSGGNDDGNMAHPLRPGVTKVIADIRGPGVITHIWMTVNSRERFHLKKLVLRMIWDDEPTPSVEVPLGDFFGLGLGEYFLYESAPLSVGSQKALNCFFPMPFSSSARITLTNEGKENVAGLYYNIDHERHSSLPSDLGRFHAQYRQATPTAGWTSTWKANGDSAVNTRRNRTGEGNYTILEATGRGHYVGAAHSILLNQGDWWGEGDDMIFVDGAVTPTIAGTGAEDYYLGAWCYSGCGTQLRPTFSYQRYGNPMNGGDDRNGKWMVYRFHLESPITFTTSIRVTIESGHANHRSDNYFTVAYWYQTEPHSKLPPLPPVDARVPRLIQTGGPEVRPY